MDKNKGLIALKPYRFRGEYVFTEEKKFRVTSMFRI